MIGGTTDAADFDRLGRPKLGPWFVAEWNTSRCWACQEWITAGSDARYFGGDVVCFQCGVEDESDDE